MRMGATGLGNRWVMGDQQIGTTVEIRTTDAHGQYSVWVEVVHGPNEHGEWVGEDADTGYRIFRPRQIVGVAP